MAAQIKPHTPEQIRGLKPFVKKSECPECKHNSFSVLESRKVSRGRRRRFFVKFAGSEKLGTRSVEMITKGFWN